MPKALLTCHHLQRHFATLRPQYETVGVEPILPHITGQQMDAAAMRKAIRGVDAVIAGDDEIDASVLEAGKESGLKAIIKWGIGTDSIDKLRAAELGIPVFNTPGAFSEEVADLGLSLLLLLARRTHDMHASILTGGWHKSEGRSLHGLTAGVIGLGSIGRAIARRVAACGMTPIGSDIAPIDAEVLAQNNVQQVPITQLLTKSDVILLACNLTKDNKHLLNADAFAAMKDGVTIVNVARGPLIDETALVDALESGKVAAAGLDVFEVEPLPTDSPLRRFKSCVFSSHNGSNTNEAVARINQMTTDILFDVLGVKSLSGFTPNRVA